MTHAPTLIAINRSVLAALLLAALNGCGHAAQPRADDFVSVPAKHNGSGVALSHDAPARLEPGRATNLRLRFDGGEGARVQLRAPEGVSLRLADGSAAPAEMTLPPGRSSTLALQVTPQAEGLHYLAVTTLRGGRSSVQAVPLQVGAAAPRLKRDGEASTTPAGEAVISLPARP